MLNCPNENFVVLMMPGNVLSIAEPMHEQCIISFMIIGLDKILLLDTCTGIPKRGIILLKLISIFRFTIRQTMKKITG